MADWSWSYSKWSLWKSCPAAYKYKTIDKIPEPPSPALEKGRRVHDEISHYLKGETDTRPASLKLFTTLADDLRTRKQAGAPIHVELQFAVDRDLRQTSWFGKTTWFRAAWDVIIDSGPSADAIDWKTGKPYGSYEDQKAIFALAAFWRTRELEEFRGHWLYNDHGDTHEATFTKSQAADLHKVWVANASMMESDRAFAPTPSQDACKFCNFSWRKSGPCKAGV